MSKILIVEDEESIAELEKDYLELSGFEVEIENDGEAGLKRAMSEEFDLFILDLMLPGVDGFEICKKIRETKNTPIIMMIGVFLGKECRSEERRVGKECRSRQDPRSRPRRG